MLSALSTGHKTVIVVVAAVFIVFALCCSFVFSRMNPNFPGKRIALFVVVCALLTAAMLGAIIVFATEPPEAGAKVEERNPVLSQTTGTETTSPAAPAGNATAGKALFASQGCNACHTFRPAGSTAKVGPDLDDLAANAKTANRGTVQEYTAESIEDPGAYVVPGYPNGVMPQFQLSDKQVADLVAFLTGGS